MGCINVCSEEIVRRIIMVEIMLERSEIRKHSSEGLHPIWGNRWSFPIRKNRWTVVGGENMNAGLALW